jgi:hypothetical protein
LAYPKLCRHSRSSRRKDDGQAHYKRQRWQAASIQSEEDYEREIEDGEIEDDGIDNRDGLVVRLTDEEEE